MESSSIPGDPVVSLRRCCPTSMAQPAHGTSLLRARLTVWFVQGEILVVCPGVSYLACNGDENWTHFCIDVIQPAASMAGSPRMGLRQLLTELRSSTWDDSIWMSGTFVIQLADEMATVENGDVTTFTHSALPNPPAFSLEAVSPLVLPCHGDCDVSVMFTMDASVSCFHVHRVSL